MTPIVQYDFLPVLLYARCDITPNRSTITPNSVHSDVGNPGDAGDWRQLLGEAMHALTELTREELRNEEPMPLELRWARHYQLIHDKLARVGKKAMRDEVFETMKLVEEYVEDGNVRISEKAYYDRIDRVRALNDARMNANGKDDTDIV